MATRSRLMLKKEQSDFSTENSLKRGPCYSIHMDYDMSKIIPGNYQRAFFFKKIGCLVGDYVNSHYKKRNFLAVYQDDMYGTYIENAAADAALQNGKEIFSSERNFAVFEAGFRDTIKECEAYIRKALK